MTTPTEESAPVIPETEDVPVLEVPGESGDKPASREGAGDAKAQAKEVAAILAKDPDFLRGLVVVKDRRMNLLDPSNPKIVDMLVPRVAAALKRSSGDEDEAIRQVRLDLAAEHVLGSGEPPELEQARAGALATPPAREPKPQGDLKSWTSQVLTGAGIAFDDPEYKAIVAEFQSGFDEAEFKGAVRHLAAVRKAAAPVSPSAVVAETLGVPGTVTQTGLRDQFIKEALALQAEAGRDSGRMEMRQLKAKYRAKGVDVDSIDFSALRRLPTQVETRAREKSYHEQAKPH